MANPIALVNGQEIKPNQTNATGGVKGVVTITKIDVDPIMKAVKDRYLRAGDIKDDQSLIHFTFFISG